MSTEPLNLYDELKDMPNPSAGLLKLVKKPECRNSRIWVTFSAKEWSKGEFVSLTETRRRIKNWEMDGAKYILGYYNATTHGKSKEKEFKDGMKAILTHSYIGRHVLLHMFHGHSDSLGEYINVGDPKKGGAWLVDITDLFVEKIKTIGPCAISEPHCVYEQVSPKIKVCKFCGNKRVLKIETVKQEKWVLKGKKK